MHQHSPIFISICFKTLFYYITLDDVKSNPGSVNRYVCIGKVCTLFQLNADGKNGDLLLLLVINMLIFVKVIRPWHDTPSFINGNFSNTQAKATFILK